MIAKHIQEAIAALLSTDKGATDEERTAVMAAASGQWRALTIVEVARRLFYGGRFAKSFQHYHLAGLGWGRRGAPPPPRSGPVGRASTPSANRARSAKFTD